MTDEEFMREIERLQAERGATLEAIRLVKLQAWSEAVEKLTPTVQELRGSLAEAARLLEVWKDEFVSDPAAMFLRKKTQGFLEELEAKRADEAESL